MCSCGIYYLAASSDNLVKNFISLYLLCFPSVSKVNYRNSPSSSTEMYISVFLTPGVQPSVLENCDSCNSCYKRGVKEKYQL